MPLDLPERVEITERLKSRCVLVWWGYFKGGSTCVRGVHGIPLLKLLVPGGLTPKPPAEHANRFVKRSVACGSDKHPPLHYTKLFRISDYLSLNTAAATKRNHGLGTLI
jgi:hypothetical protein